MPAAEKNLDVAYPLLVDALRRDDCDDTFAHYRSRVGLGRVAATGAVLGTLCGLHLALLYFRWSSVLVSAYAAHTACLCIFHLLEFFMTAAFNARTATWDSFLLNHSRNFSIAMVAAWAEYIIEVFFFESTKTWIVNWVRCDLQWPKP